MKKWQNNKQTAKKRLQTKWARNDGSLLPPDGQFAVEGVA
jgi:hypothetical protein